MKEARKVNVDYARLVSEPEDKNDPIMFEMDGPPNTPYENGVFDIEFHSIRHYPNQPPKIRFKTNTYHCNIHSRNGRLCCPKLTDYSYNSHWSVETALHETRKLLITPDPSYAINDNAMCSFVENKDKYNETAKKYTQKFAKHKV